MRFCKYHGLGNDYLVLDPAEIGTDLTEERIRRICDRHLGVGADGILLGPLSRRGFDFAVRIYNPDGSEAEKSGNGLRIFARYLCDTGRAVASEAFPVLTEGGLVQCRVDRTGGSVTVEMGQISFQAEDIPVTGEPREVLDEELTVLDRTFRFSAATIGNPHCVIMREEVSADETRTYGPAVEALRRFPNRTNVQFMQVLDRRTIRIEIWERGAGYTTASGTSSCAAAAVARRLGLCDDRIVVRMPGGDLAVAIGPDYRITMTGPVTKVCEGVLSEETFSHAPPE